MSPPFEDFTNSLTDAELENLLRKDLGPSLQFDNAVDIVRQVKTVLERANALDRDDFPHPALPQADQAITNLQSLMQQIRDFDLNVSQPLTQRDNLTAQLKQFRDQIYVALGPILPILPDDSATATAAATSAAEAAQAATATLKPFLTKLEKLESDVASQLSLLQAGSVTSAVSQVSGYGIAVGLVDGGCVGHAA